MFQIDRSYIDHISLECIQGRIWDIRMDHKDDPTLPKIQNYNITEEAFEAYLEKKQKFEDFQDSWRKYRYMILGLAFVVPVALFSLLIKDKNMAMYAYATGFLLCMLIYMIYLLIEAAKAKHFKNNPYETFIKALLSWEANNK
jgi:archaellum biogenesis protein FlaJ (TadC family)